MDLCGAGSQVGFCRSLDPRFSTLLFFRDVRTGRFFVWDSSMRPDDISAIVRAFGKTKVRPPVKAETLSELLLATQYSILTSRH